MTLTHNKVECPNCSHEINVENILYEQIEKQSQKVYSAKLSEQDKIFKKKLEDLESEKAKLEEEKNKKLLTI